MGADARPPRVLLLESDAKVRQILSYGLGRQGFEVVCVSSPDEAQRTLSAAPVQPTVMVAEVSARAGLRAGDDPLPLPLILVAKRAETLPQAPGAFASDECLHSPVFVRDVVALAQLKLKPRAADGAFDVGTDALPLPDLIRALLTGGRSGRLALMDGQGHLTFAQGRVVQVNLGELDGREALVRLLLFARGGYEVSFGPALARSELVLDLRELCEQILPRVRSFQLAAEKLLPLEDRVVPDFHSLTSALPELPQGVGAILRLCDGRRTVREVILASPLDEQMTHASLTRLKELGVLVEWVAPHSSVVVETQSPLWQTVMRQERNTDSREVSAEIEEPRDWAPGGSRPKGWPR